MDGTRVERRKSAPRSDERVTQPLAVPDEKTRIKPAPPRAPRGLGFEERVTLFAYALQRDRAKALLDGLGARAQERARTFLLKLESEPSAERQGRMAFEFGIRRDAAQRLRDVWNQAGPALRRETFAQLPPYHRSVFPEYAPPPTADAVSEAPGLKAFAERLIREATR